MHAIRVRVVTLRDATLHYLIVKQNGTMKGPKWVNVW